MSSTSDKLKGAANQVIGKAKRGVGQAVGSNTLKGEGVLQEAKGVVQHAAGRTKAAVKKAFRPRA